MNRHIYIGFSFTELSIIQKAIEENIFSLSQDRFSAEQAERYRDAEELTKRLFKIKNIHTRVRRTINHLINVDVTEEQKRIPLNKVRHGNTSS